MKKLVLAAAAGAALAAIGDTATFKMPDGTPIEMKRLPGGRELGRVPCETCGGITGTLVAVNVNAPESQRTYECAKCNAYKLPPRSERRSNKHTRVRRPKTTRKERAAAQ